MPLGGLARWLFRSQDGEQDLLPPFSCGRRNTATPGSKIPFFQRQTGNNDGMMGTPVSAGSFTSQQRLGSWEAGLPPGSGMPSRAGWWPLPCDGPFCLSGVADHHQGDEEGWHLSARWRLTEGERALPLQPRPYMKCSPRNFPASCPWMAAHPSQIRFCITTFSVSETALKFINDIPVH